MPEASDTNKYQVDQNEWAGTQHPNCSEQWAVRCDRYSYRRFPSIRDLQLASFKLRLLVQGTGVRLGFAILMPKGRWG